MAQLEPHTQEFIDSLTAMGGRPLYELSPEEARDFLESLQAEYVYDIPAQIEDLMIPGGDLGPISIRIVRPADYVSGVLPVVMYFHGGGWILGSERTHDRLIREIANGSQSAVVFVNYTPSPEARYPIAVEEAYTATKYIADNARSMNLDASRLAVAGDSVGGNMATVVTLLAKYRGGPDIVFQALLYPVTDSNFNTDSYYQFADGPWLTKKAMEWFWDAYEPDVEKRNDPLFSPLQATLEELSGLPSALVITDENDVLRDEGEAYAHKLMDAGVNVSAVRCLGTMHDFAMLNAISNTPATRTAIQLVNLKLYDALH